MLAHFRGLVMLALLIAFFDVIFTALPNRKLSFRGQLPGAVICGVAWYVFSFGLSVYVDYFNGFFHVRQPDDYCLDYAVALLLHVHHDDVRRGKCGVQRLLPQMVEAL